MAVDGALWCYGLFRRNVRIFVELSAYFRELTKHYTIDMKLHPYNYLSTSSEQVESHPQSRFSSDKRRSRWNLIFNFNCDNICGLFLLATVEKVIYLSVQRKISTTFNPQINKLTGREDRSIK